VIYTRWEYVDRPAIPIKPVRSTREARAWQATSAIASSAGTSWSPQIPAPRSHMYHDGHKVPRARDGVVTAAAA